MEKIAPRNTYEFFYLTGVLLLLAFSSVMSANTHKDFANAKALSVSPYHKNPLELGPVYFSEAKYCTSEETSRQNVQTRTCDEHGQPWFDTNLEGPTLNFENKVFSGSKNMGGKEI